MNVCICMKIGFLKDDQRVEFMLSFLHLISRHVILRHLITYSSLNLVKGSTRILWLFLCRVELFDRQYGTRTYPRLDKKVKSFSNATQ